MEIPVTLVKNLPLVERANAALLLINLTQWYLDEREQYLGENHRAELEKLCSWAYELRYFLS